MPSVIRNENSSWKISIWVVWNLNFKSCHVEEFIGVMASSQLNWFSWLRINVYFDRIFSIDSSTKTKILVIRPGKYSSWTWIYTGFLLKMVVSLFACKTIFLKRTKNWAAFRTCPTLTKCRILIFPAVCAGLLKVVKVWNLGGTADAFIIWNTLYAIVRTFSN